MKNYMNDFYKNTNRTNSYENFFNITSNEVINMRKAALKKATEEYEKAQQELKKAYSQKYSENYTPSEFKNYLRYTNRNGDEFYYTEEGYSEPPRDDENVVIKDLKTKNGVIEIITGYCYELGSIIIKTYSYEIKSNPKLIKLDLINEIIFSVLDGIGYATNGDKVYKSRVDLNAREFIKNMYGRELQKIRNINFSVIMEANKLNKATEVIIKTAPEEILIKMLGMNFEKSMPIYKLMGLKQETYEELVESGEIDLAYDLLPYIHAKDVFHLTEEEWADLIKRNITYREDLDFYQIRVRSMYSIYLRQEHHKFGSFDISKSGVYWAPISGENPILELAEKYYKDENIRKDYTFRKYVDYVINETVNQGYTSISYFTSELDDYLRMCRLSDAKPSLYTNHLSQTHDILARNYKISVSAEQEATFKSKYEGFNKVIVNDYVVKAPTCSKDVSKEGSELNHCVGSYIKRIINGETLIYFLRDKHDENTSLLTFEVRNNEIVQVRGKFNRLPSRTEMLALKKYATKVGLQYI